MTTTAVLRPVLQETKALVVGIANDFVDACVRK
jgi:hypothetical protein